MTPAAVQGGASAIVPALPHSGPRVPEDAGARLTPCGRGPSDTDRHIERPNDGLPTGAARRRRLKPIPETLADMAPTLKGTP